MVEWGQPGVSSANPPTSGLKRLCFLRSIVAVSFVIMEVLVGRLYSVSATATQPLAKTPNLPSP